MSAARIIALGRLRALLYSQGERLGLRLLDEVEEALAAEYEDWREQLAEERRETAEAVRCALEDA
jgi:hypothetical protein